MRRRQGTVAGMLARQTRRKIFSVIRRDLIQLSRDLSYASALYLVSGEQRAARLGLTVSL